MATAAEFAEKVKALEGVEFHHRGRTLAGLDCAGVPALAAEQLGVVASASQIPSAYGRMPSGEETTAGLSAFCDRDERPVLSVGRVVQAVVGKQARHVMVVVGITAHNQVSLVHAWSPARKVVSCLLSHDVHATWRVRGVTYG